MKLEIPDGTIIDVPGNWRLESDPAAIHAACCSAMVYNHLTAGLDQDQAESPDFALWLGDIYTTSAAYPVFMHGRGLVLPVTVGGTMSHLLVREGRQDQPWQVSTKMLVLPFNNPDVWSEEDEAAFVQRHARVLLFVGLAMLNGWFRPLPAAE